MNIISERHTSVADQEWFAAVSGDFNPMHMDALAARRTLAGFPVVHGIHTLLWALDSTFRYLPQVRNLAAMRVTFEKMVYVGDRVRAVLMQHDEKRLRLEVVVGEITVMAIDLQMGKTETDDAEVFDGPMHQPPAPAELTFDQMTTSHGWVPLPGRRAEIGEMFPAVTALLGIARVAGLAASSFLVGMVCPGLHSIYRGLNLAIAASEADVWRGLHFRVKYKDPDYRLLRLSVSGAGWVGTIDTNARPRPTAQADMTIIGRKVRPDEFAGGCALVIGGSRGLGELVTKLLGAGGAQVICTYAVGQNDAQRVQAEIAEYGGRCNIMRYDVRARAETQLAALALAPTHLYYMATPPIFRRALGAFSPERLQEFLAFYVTGFSDLCSALRPRSGLDLAIFYPSSSAVADRPANMTEYTMAKVAGEILCADMLRFGKWRRLLVRRLPRLATDQTATLFDDDLSDDPLEILLPLVRELQTHRG